MKWKYFVALTLFSALTIFTTFSTHADLQQAQSLLNNKIGVLDSYNTVLLDAKTTMKDEKDNWNANEEDIWENRIDYATGDPWGLGGAVLKQLIDFQHRAEIAVALGAAIGAVQTAKTDADNAQVERDTAWNNYVRLADAAGISDADRLKKGADALPVTYPDVTISCPGCDLSWSGSGIGGMAGHISYCSVKGHKNTADELVSEPLPHFSCQSCPLSHQHFTFPCRGGCGEMCRQPTIVTPPPAQGVVPGHTTNYYDHGYACQVDVPGFGNCPQTAYTCQDPECPNDANHLVYGDCKKHKVKKSDTTALAAHKKLASPVYCSVTHIFDNVPYACIITRVYKCDPVSHAPWHDFVPGPGTYPGASESSPSQNGGCTLNPGEGTGNPPGNGGSPPASNGGCTPTSTLVDCSQRRANSCYTQVSSANEHYVTCGDSDCGDSYWSCDSDDYDHHRLRSCNNVRRTGYDNGALYCDNTWRSCEYVPERIPGTVYSIVSPSCNLSSNRYCAE